MEIFYIIVQGVFIQFTLEKIAGPKVKHVAFAESLRILALVFSLVERLIEIDFGFVMVL